MTIQELTIDKIQSVYRGKPGCACGCNGKYYYSPNAKETAADRGSKVNLKMVRSVLFLLQSNPEKVTQFGDGFYLETREEGKTFAHAIHLLPGFTSDGPEL